MTATDRGTRRFQPTFWPTVFAVVGVTLLVGLGIWQVERLAWKRGLIADRAAAMAAPAMEHAGAVELPRDEFRHISLTGTYLHDREMYLVATSKRAGALGYDVVTPLRLGDGSVVLINRGWVPRERKDPATRRDGLTKGTVTVTGLIRRGGRRNWLTPDNDPAKNIWFDVAFDQMAAHARLQHVRHFVVEAGPKENPPGVYPIGGQSRTALPNNHLQYAITWFALAVALTVIYFVYHYRRPEDRKEQAGDDGI